MHFFGTQFQLSVSQSLEDLTEAVEVLFPCGGEYDDIIEVEEACFPVKTGEDAIHEAGGGGSVAEAKGDPVKLKELATACAKRCLFLALLLDRDLPVSTLEIKSGKPARRSSMRGRGCVSLLVAALSCQKSMQKRRLPSFFLTITTERGPRAVGWTDDAACQHLLDLGHFFSPDSGVLPMIGLTEGWSFGFNGVLQQRGAAKIIL